MGLQIVTKKRFVLNLKKITAYLRKEWSKPVVEDFKILVFKKLELLAQQPDIGTTTKLPHIKSVLVGKGYQNRIYYRVEKNTLIVIDIKDTRKNPKQNRFQ